MKIPALLGALLALIVSVAPACAQTDAKSSSDDRQRFVSIVHSLERAPLDASLKDDRSWAVQWLIDAPDVTVTACLDTLGGVSDKTYAHAADVVVQYSLAMGAFVVENPSKSGDPEAQQLAGVESALNAYRAMRGTQPGKTSQELDKLLDMQSRGDLPAFVRKAFVRCSSKGAPKAL